MRSRGLWTGLERDEWAGGGRRYHCSSQIIRLRPNSSSGRRRPTATPAALLPAISNHRGNRFFRTLERRLGALSGVGEGQHAAC